MITDEEMDQHDRQLRRDLTELFTTLLRAGDPRVSTPERCAAEFPAATRMLHILSMFKGFERLEAPH